MKAVANSTFAGYEQLDHSLETPNVFPTLWTVHTDHNQGEWVLDRYDTWSAETYNFTMFDVNKAESTTLGIHHKISNGNINKLTEAEKVAIKPPFLYLEQPKRTSIHYG